MRPRGQIFLAALEAFSKLGKATWRQVYEFVTRRGVQTTVTAVRRTVENMARRGHLQPKEPMRVPGIRHPMRLYALPVERPDRTVSLADAMAMWGSPVGNA